MLANGIKLSYIKTGSTYTELSGLQEVPEIGDEPEKVENTTLSDTAKQYEYGIGDYGDLEFTFKYDNSSADSSYRILRTLAKSKSVTKFKMTFPDGTSFNWDAQVSIKISGGGVNSPISFKLKMALASDITVEDPTVTISINEEKGDE